MLLETDRQNYPEEWLCHLRVCDDLLPKKQQHKAFSEVMVCTGSHSNCLPFDFCLRDRVITLKQDMFLP